MNFQCTVHYIENCFSAPSKIPENVKTRILAKSAKNPNRGKKDEYRDFRHKQLEDKPAVPRRNELVRIEI